MLRGRDLELLKQRKKTFIFQTNFPANRVVRCFQDKKRELALCRQQLLLSLLWLLLKKNKICIESLNVLAINYSTDNRPGPKHFGKQLQMKHGTNNSLAWPVSLYIVHVPFHLTTLRTASSFLLLFKFSGWMSLQVLLQYILRGEQQWKWPRNIGVQAPQKWNKDFSLLSSSHSSFSTMKCFCPEPNQGSK